MKNKKAAVYPGSFNPVHPGHLQIIQQAAQVFDEVIVLIADNPGKTYTVSHKKRAEFIRRFLTGFPWFSKVRIEYTNGSLVDYCAEHEIEFIVRGLRNGTDLEYEKTQYEYNMTLAVEKCPTLTYVYFTTPVTANHLSSSAVKQFMKYATLDQFILLYQEAGWLYATNEKSYMQEIMEAYNA